MPLEGRYRFAMSLLIASTKTERPTTTNPWVLSDRALTVLYGCPEMPRPSHYFLPRLVFAKKQILYLDGANQISPLLLARFARKRSVDPSSVNSLIRASFEHALEGLANVAPLSLSIAVFSDATSFKTKRRDFFQRLRNQADHVVKVESTPENKLSFTREKNTPLLPA